MWATTGSLNPVVLAMWEREKDVVAVVVWVSLSQRHHARLPPYHPQIYRLLFLKRQFPIVGVRSNRLWVDLPNWKRYCVHGSWPRLQYHRPSETLHRWFHQRFLVSIVPHPTPHGSNSCDERTKELESEVDSPVSICQRWRIWQPWTGWVDTCCGSYRTNGVQWNNFDPMEQTIGRWCIDGCNPRTSVVFSATQVLLWVNLSTWCKTIWFLWRKYVWFQSWTWMLCPVGRSPRQWTGFESSLQFSCASFYFLISKTLSKTGGEGGQCPQDRIIFQFHYSLSICPHFHTITSQCINNILHGDHFPETFHWLFVFLICVPHLCSSLLLWLKSI